MKKKKKKNRKEELADGLDDVRHEDAPYEGGFLREVRQQCRVVQVGACDEKHVHRGRVNLVEVWQRRLGAEILRLHLVLPSFATSLFSTRKA